VEPIAANSERGIITGKIFESLGLGVKTVVIAPLGSDLETLAGRTELVRVFQGEQAETLADYLNALSRPSERATPPLDYAWPTQAFRLEAILREALEWAPIRSVSGRSDGIIAEQDSGNAI
jgi:hypothetical protein